jgi:CO dehydrogenase maturation factor
VKIAVSGKGGVGKTFIAGTLGWLFAQDGYQVIAIDADSSPNLAQTLGLTQDESEKILPISENRELIEHKTSTGYPGVYNLTFTVDDIVSGYAIPTPSGVNLLVMGTVSAMNSGCTCQANTVVRALLRHIVGERRDVVIVDLEAGVEHLGRGTAEYVDIMLIITDASRKALLTAKRIAGLSMMAGIRRVLLVGNMIENQDQRDMVSAFARAHHLEAWCCVPFSRNIREDSILGRPVFDRPEEAPILAIRELKKILGEGVS